MRSSPRHNLALAHAPELLTVMEVALLLDVEVRTVREWVRRGRLRPLSNSGEPELTTALIPKSSLDPALMTCAMWKE